MSDLDKILALGERQAAALERIAAALELANYERVFPPVSQPVTIDPYPYPQTYPTYPIWPQPPWGGTFTVTVSDLSPLVSGG